MEIQVQSNAKPHVRGIGLVHRPASRGPIDNEPSGVRRAIQRIDANILRYGRCYKAPDIGQGAVHALKIASRGDPLLIHGIFLEVWKYLHDPTDRVLPEHAADRNSTEIVSASAVVVVGDIGKPTVARAGVGGSVAVECEPQLLEVVTAGVATGGLTGSLHRRQEQPDERADDGDHDQEFDEREARGCSPMVD